MGMNSMEYGATTPDAAGQAPTGGTPRQLAGNRARGFQRLTSMLLGGTAFAAVMVERGLSLWYFAALLVVVIGLPALSYALRQSMRNASRVTVFDVLGGHLFAGLGTSALLAFNALPSLLTFAFLGAAGMTLGGLPILIAGTLIHGIGVLIGIALVGFHWAPDPSLFVLVGCVPFMVLQPMIDARLTGNAVRTARRRQSLLERQSRLDGLSGLYNRTFWESLVRRTYDTCRQGRQASATLIMADLDFFKHINDVHGHEAGDQVIRGFATLLHEQLRNTDICGRYGGEEFGILMPMTSAADACVVIERLRSALRDRPLLPHGRVTASFGLAEWNAEISDHETWMRLADQMLYRAKHLGRDRLAVLGEISQVSDEIAADRQRPIVPRDTQPAGPPALRNPLALHAVLAGLDFLEQPFALFDPSDRLAYGNPTFVELYQVPAGSPTFSDIIRHCHRLGVGPRIVTDDIEEWLRKAQSKRLSQARRAFAVDLIDGRWFWVSEVSYDNGWLLMSMTDVTPAYAAAAPLELALTPATG